MSRAKSRYRIAKYLGDDAYSWALFEDGRPVMTGMDRSEAGWRLKRERTQEAERRAAVTSAQS